MSEAAPESGARPRTAAPASSGGGGGGSSPFTRKIGPLPMWAWMGLILLLALVYSVWKKNKAASSTSSTSGTSSTGTEATQTADQTPPFIIQNYSAYDSQTTTNNTTTSPAPPPPTNKQPPPIPPPIQGGNPPHGPGGPVQVSPPSSPTNGGGITTTKKATPVTYRVKPGDTLTSIAAKYGVKGGWQALWAYNIGTGNGTANRPASTIATLKQRGPNLLYSNEEIYIPPA